MAEEAPIQSTTSTVSSILPYQCWACDKRFSCQSQMKNHEVVHSDEKPFVCEVCNRGFRRKDRCKILLNFGSIICWTSYTSLVTDICSTEKKYDMKRHVQLIHKIQAKEESRSYTPRGNANNNSGKLAQVFECEVCQKQFSCSSHLRNHEVVHSEERPFKCEFCDKARVFFWLKDLSRLK